MQANRNYIYAKRPFTSYPAVKHPEHSKFAITDMREKSVDFFYCTTRASTLFLEIILKLSFLCKSFLSFRICNSLMLCTNRSCLLICWYANKYIIHTVNCEFNYNCKLYRKVFVTDLYSLPKYNNRPTDICDVCIKKGGKKYADVYCTTCCKKYCAQHLEVTIFTLDIP